MKLVIITSAISLLSVKEIKQQVRKTAKAMIMSTFPDFSEATLFIIAGEFN